MSTQVNLPCSDQPPYPKGYWKNVEAQLTKLQGNPKWEVLQEVVLMFLNQTKLIGARYGAFVNIQTLLERSVEGEDIPDFKTLNQLQIIISRDPSLLTLIPEMCGHALAMPHRFPTSSLAILMEGSNSQAQLTKGQEACLIAHMFFCTFLPSTELYAANMGHFSGHAAPTGPITFRYWHTSLSSRGPTAIYIQSVFNYFRSLGDRALETNGVSYQRFSRKDSPEVPWSASKTRLIPMKLSLNGLIGEDHSEVEMDFANKHVGFGTTGTQEELLLGSSTETCPIVLFNEILGPKDALVMKGARRYSNFVGYGFSAHYKGPCTDDRDWNERTILTMDALPHIGTLRDQLTTDMLRRELEKAYCAFSAVSGRTVGTGHWGCGAFGGNMGLKALIQLMAASEAGVGQLNFYCFKENLFYTTMKECLEQLDCHCLTVEHVWRLLKEFEADGLRSCGGESTSEDVWVIKWINKKLKANEIQSGAKSSFK